MAGPRASPNPASCPLPPPAATSSTTSWTSAAASGALERPGAAVPRHGKPTRRRPGLPHGTAPQPGPASPPHDDQGLRTRLLCRGRGAVPRGQRPRPLPRNPRPARDGRCRRPPDPSRCRHVAATNLQPVAELLHDLGPACHGLHTLPAATGPALQAFRPRVATRHAALCAQHGPDLVGFVGWVWVHRRGLRERGVPLRKLAPADKYHLIASGGRGRAQRSSPRRRRRSGVRTAGVSAGSGARSWPSAAAG